MSLPSDVYEVPPLDSKSSVGTGSPTLLSPDVRSSVGSSPGTPTIKFAPLPQTDPTRKRSLAPLGASARSRRRRALQREAGPLLWSTDPGLPEDALEDPLVTFAKFVRKTGRTLWRRVRKSSRPVEDVPYSGEPVLDIKSPDESTERGVEEDKRRRRATWSPSDERRTLSLDEPRRRKSDVSLHRDIP